MKNVLLIDSGSGGINILKECIKIVPSCNYLMFCDNKNLPYGNKSKEELQKITLKNLNEIYSFFKFDIVILACNTLTCTCLELCRKSFPDKTFIGTVPAIKPALKDYEAKDILVLATEVTIKHNVLINKTPNLILKSMPTLASDIDNNLDELMLLKESLRSQLQGLKPKAVVLGCTHYIAVKDLINEVFENKVEFFDSANGVARRLKSFVSDEEIAYQLQFMVTSSQEFLPRFWFYYNSK